MKRAIVIILMCCFLLAQPSALFAWEQSAENQTHQQINYEAIKVFANRFSGLEKYRLGPVDINSAERYRGIAVTSSSKFVDPLAGTKYTIAEQDLTMTQWIVWGGAWADEPHLYASVRHFYDPVMEPRYLTDQSTAHGLYDSPQMDARTWGLDAEDNPFNFYNALLYYKKALETPETGQPDPFIWSSDHFKLNLDLVPANRAEERNIYLAMAYRALGESMHMLADMTQPAHVRNDSHPFIEPVEQTITMNDVMDAASSGMVEPRIGQYLMSAGAGSVLEPWELFLQVALFTNQNFYSSDTIYDKPSNEWPYNGETPYPSPQFDDFIMDTREANLGLALETNEVYIPPELLGKRKINILNAAYINDKIPMAQEKLSYSVFQPMWMQIEEMLYHRYHVPPSFAKDQGRVLLPVAIYACADLIHLFFPTLELKAEYKDLGDQPGEVEGREDYHRQVIQVDTTMVHRQTDDPAWEKMGLKIDYAGLGELVFEKKGKVTKTRKINFENGKVVAIEGYKGDMVERPLEVYVASGDNNLIDEEAFYEAEKGSSLYIKIEAGSRVFKSPVFDIGEGFEVVIQPPRIKTYELQQGATEATHEFKAVARPEGQYTFEWDFDDGNSTSQKGTSSIVKNTYKGVGDYYPVVRLYNKYGELLAEDTANVRLEGDVAKDSDTYICNKNNIELTLLSVKKVPDNNWTKTPPEGYGYVVLRYKVKNIGSESYYAGMGKQIQWDDNGIRRAYAPYSGVDGYLDLVSPEDLAPGAEGIFDEVYEMRNGLSKVDFAYSPGLGAGWKAHWCLTIE